MKLLNFTLNIKNKEYSLNNFDSDLFLLGDFLSTEAYPMRLELIKKLLTASQASYAGNIYYAQKKKTMIEIGDLFDDDSPPLNIPFNNFFNLLDKWKIMYEHLPEKATINMDDDYNFDIIY